MKKVILISGSSSGLGLALARQLSKKFIVYASMRSSLKLESFKKEASKSFIPIQLDVTDSQSIQRALKKIDHQHQKIDVLINNAGVMHMGLFEAVSEEEFKKLFETNFFGMVNLTREALFLLKKSLNGKIINISSSSGLMAMPALSAYAASKWAMEGFSESLRFELKFLGIEVLLIEPGLIQTELLKENFKVIENEKLEGAFLMKKLLKKWHRLDPKTFLNPQQVSKVIEKRILEKKPPFRTLLSTLSKIKFFLKIILPFKIYEKILSKILGF